VEEHDLGGMELFLFTDNSTAEAAFWKGHSKSRKLFEIALQFRKLEMKYDLLLHVIHISGRRVIWQGSDGLSRVDKATGAMQGRIMEELIPLHLSALNRSERLKVGSTR
jgi:hypothetical protein